MQATNPPPRTPVRHPTMTQPGRVSIVGGAISSVPNLRVDAETVRIVVPFIRSPKIAKVNTAMAQVKNTFQTTENFQKVLGFEIS